MKRTLISEFIEQVRGVSYKPADIHDTLDEESIPLLRANNIRDGLINFDDVIYIDKSKVSKKQLLQKGDILICASSGSINLVGKAAQVDFDGEYTFGAFCKVVRPIHSMAAYLGFFFQSSSYRKTISDVAQGANINNIRNEHIDELVLNTYDSQKQGEIVHQLTIVQQIIRCRQLELQKLDEFVKARFVEMFGDPVFNDKGWEQMLLGEITSKIGSGATPKGGKEAYRDDGITLIRSMNVHNGKFEYKDLAHISDEQASKLDNVTIEENDVLLNITGASVARSCIVPNDVLPARVNQHVCIIRCKECITPEFLNKLLIDDNYQDLLWSIAGSGATREAITKQQVEGLQIILPPLKLQREFMAFCKQVDKSKVAVQKALDEAQLLFDSLMQKYFG